MRRFKPAYPKTFTHFVSITVLFFLFFESRVAADITLYLHRITFHNGVVVDRITSLPSDPIRSKLRSYIKAIQTIHEVPIKEDELVKTIGFPLYYHLKLYDAFKVWRDEEFMSWQKAGGQPPLKTLPRPFTEDPPSLTFLAKLAAKQAKKKAKRQAPPAVPIPTLLDSGAETHHTFRDTSVTNATPSLSDADLFVQAEKRRLNLENLSSLIKPRHLKEMLQTIFQNIRSILRPLSPPGKRPEPLFLVSKSNMKEAFDGPDIAPLLTEILKEICIRNRYRVVSQESVETALSDASPSHSQKDDTNIPILKEKLGVRFVIFLCWEVDHESLLLTTELLDLKDQLVRHQRTYPVPLFDTI